MSNRMTFKSIILPLLVNIILISVLYFVIENHPEFIYPTLVIEFIVYIGIVAIDDEINIRKYKRRKEKPLTN